MSGIGKFGEPRGQQRKKTSIKTGDVEIADESMQRNTTVEIETGIGSKSRPKQLYRRKSGVKSRGGYDDTTVVREKP